MNHAVRLVVEPFPVVHFGISRLFAHPPAKDACNVSVVCQTYIAVPLSNVFINQLIRRVARNPLICVSVIREGTQLQADNCLVILENKL